MRRELIGFDIYVFIDKTAGAVKFRLDDIVIGATFGLGPIAHFNIATKLNGYFFDVVARLVPVPTSIYTRYHGKGEHQQIRDKFFILARINIIFGILGTGAALIFAWSFITLWVGKEYLDAFPPLVIIMAARIPSLALRPANDVIYAMAKNL